MTFGAPQVNRPTLCKNIIRAIGSSANPQPFDNYPIGHRVTWKYYMGMLAFLEEDYTKVYLCSGVSYRRMWDKPAHSRFHFIFLFRSLLFLFLSHVSLQADEQLSWAFENCHHASYHNLQFVLISSSHLSLFSSLRRGLSLARIIATFYLRVVAVNHHLNVSFTFLPSRKILHLLLPIHLLRGILPSAKLLTMFPSLAAFYSPFLDAIRTSSLVAYDAALSSRQLQAVEGGVWLALERAREVVLRGVFKKVWVANGKQSRVSIGDFKAGLVVALAGGQGEKIESEEVECLVANMIYKVRPLSISRSSIPFLSVRWTVSRTRQEVRSQDGN